MGNEEDPDRRELGYLVVTLHRGRVSVDAQRAGARGAITFGGVGAILYLVALAIVPFIYPHGSTTVPVLVGLLAVPLLLAYLGSIYKGPVPRFKLEAEHGIVRFGTDGLTNSVRISNIGLFETVFELDNRFPTQSPIERHRPVIRYKNAEILHLMPELMTLGKVMSDALCACLNRSILEGGRPGDVPAFPLIERRLVVACLLGVLFALGMYLMFRYGMATR